MGACGVAGGFGEGSPWSVGAFLGWPAGHPFLDSPAARRYRLPRAVGSSSGASGWAGFASAKPAAHWQATTRKDVASPAHREAPTSTHVAGLAGSHGHPARYPPNKGPVVSRRAPGKTSDGRSRSPSPCEKNAGRVASEAVRCGHSDTPTSQTRSVSHPAGKGLGSRGRPIAPEPAPDPANDQGTEGRGRVARAWLRAGLAQAGLRVGGRRDRPGCVRRP